MSRDEGHYWVSEHDAAPEVAAWQGGAWWLTGQDEPVEERTVTVLSERLIGPDHKPCRAAIPLIVERLPLLWMRH